MSTKKRKLATNVTNSMFKVSTVVNPTMDSLKPLIMIQTQMGKKYLLGNVSEGTQRVFVSNSLKLSKIQGIFFTGILNWNKLSGLPGLILSISDQGVKNLKLYFGDESLFFFVASWRYFVFRKGMDLECNIKTDYEDDVLKVKSFQVPMCAEPIHTRDVSSESKSVMALLSNIIKKMFPLDEPENKPNKVSEMSQETLTQMTSSDPNLSDSYVNAKVPAPNATNRTTTNYLIDFKSVRGKFNKDIAVSLGLKPGKIFSELTKGNSVTLDNGSVILPADVMDPPRHFKKILVLDIISKDNIKQLLETLPKILENYQQKIGVSYYFLAPEINVESKSFQKLTHLLKETYGCDDHVISHEAICSNHINFKKAAIHSLKLSLLQPDNYYLPQLKFISPEKLVNSSIPLKVLHQFQEYEIYNDETVSHIQRSDSITEEEFWRELYTEEIKNSDYDAKFEKVLSNNTKQDQLDIDDVQIVTMGTGSAIPAQTRNVISTLVRIPTNDGSVNSYLLDCGENTLGSFKRMYKPENLKRLFQELRVLYISHLHADHHLGVISFVDEWCKHRKATQDLYIIGPWQYNNFVREVKNVDTEYSEIWNSNVKFISCEDFIVGKKLTKSNSSEQYDLKDLGLKKILTCRAHHCRWSYCVTFKTESFSFSYSGDTRPINSFANIGKHSDLLIHEATLEDDLQEMAVEKNHSTFSEALGIAKKMKAKKTILTHFSQRYPKLPDMSNIDSDLKFDFAFDGFFVNHKNIGTDRDVIKRLGALFQDDIE